MSIARYARKEKLKHGAQKSIAKRLGVSEPVVSKVMNDKLDNLSARTIERVRREIAKRVGLPVEEVFPAEISDDQRLSA